MLLGGNTTNYLTAAPNRYRKWNNRNIKTQQPHRYPAAHSLSKLADAHQSPPLPRELRVDTGLCGTHITRNMTSGHGGNTVAANKR
jgi:hypothetical protein